MAAGLTIEAEADKAAIKAFMDALARYETATKRSMKDAVRSATIDLVRSLRAKTRKAPKIVPRDDARWGESDPKYITAKDGRQFRRVVITWWAHGTSRNSVHWQLVRTKYRSRRTKRGGVSESWSEATPAMLREARQRFGGIRNWGLAKKSWGWFMKSLFHASMQDENPRAKIDSRMVDAQKRESDTEYSVVLVNRLEYIRKAMPPGAMSIALRKATNLINHKIESGLRSRRFET